MKATPQQIAKIKRLTHNANQIIDRALEGQKEHLMYNVKAMTGANRFSGATKGLTYKQAEDKLRDLEKFYESKSVLKKGWREIVETSIDNANKTLTDKMGYDLTNKELAEALKQLNKMQKVDKNRYVGMTLIQKQEQKNREFYLTVNKVQAAKDRAGDDWRGTAAEIGAALAQSLEDQQALEQILSARE